LDVGFLYTSLALVPMNYFRILDQHFKCANGFYITRDKVCNRWIDCEESHLDERFCKLIFVIF